MEMDADSSDEHPEKIWEPISVSGQSMTMDSRSEQSENAYDPMDLIRLDDRDTDLRAELLNACTPMERLATSLLNTISSMPTHWKA